MGGASVKPLRGDRHGSWGTRPNRGVLVVGGSCLFFWLSCVFHLVFFGFRVIQKGVSLTIWAGQQDLHPLGLQTKVPLEP